MKAHRKTCLRDMQLRIRNNMKQHAYTKTGVSNLFAPSLRHQLLSKASGIWHQLLPRQRSQAAKQAHERNASKSIHIYPNAMSASPWVLCGRLCGRWTRAWKRHSDPQISAANTKYTSYYTLDFLYIIICCFGCLVHFAQETRCRAN